IAVQLGDWSGYHLLAQHQDLASCEEASTWYTVYELELVLDIAIAVGAMGMRYKGIEVALIKAIAHLDCQELSQSSPEAVRRTILQVHKT
ncbi:MAG TPA: hypothetical protein PKK82_04455, partial [Anaerolineaceae bacterium]|nr:hypothetical protein [Anaerolineaceae bacterium]